MNIKLCSGLIIFAALMIPGCKKENKVDQTLTPNEAATVSKKSRGATQLSGVGFLATTDECTSPQGEGAVYAVRMTGDLEGCLYVFIDDFQCSPSGTYREQGREFFVGTYKGESGTFWTTYKFEAKYEGCAANGAALGAEIFGRCQHPLVSGSGTGVFEGATGRFNMKDNVDEGSYPYQGHIRF